MDHGENLVQEAMSATHTHAGIVNQFRAPRQYPGKAPLGVEPENYNTKDGKMYTSQRKLTEALQKKKKEVEAKRPEK